jgi:hypothetical protein
VKDKLDKISKSSFERRQYNSSNNNNNLLGHYLAGLIEGDGSIIVPKTIRNQKGKLLYFFLLDGPLGHQPYLHC